MTLIESPFNLLILLPLTLLLITWGWAWMDLLASRFMGKSTKFAWALVIITLPFFGGLLYLLLGRQDKVDRATRKFNPFSS